MLRVIEGPIRSSTMFMSLIRASRGPYEKHVSVLVLRRAASGGCSEKLLSRRLVATAAKLTDDAFSVPARWFVQRKNVGRQL